MPGRVFIFEYNEDNAFNLGEALERAGWKQVVFASTMREACTILATQVFDLGILQTEKSDHNLRVFKELQPHLPILLTAASANIVIPAFAKQRSLGILDIGQLDEQLPFYLAKLGQTSEDLPVSSGSDAAEILVDETLLGAACQAINLKSDCLAFFSIEGEIRPDPAAQNKHDPAILQAISLASCDALKTDRVQYTFPMGNGDSSLIYTRPVEQGYLTLVAPADVSISYIRQQTNLLAAQIKQQLAGTFSAAREPQILPSSRLPAKDGDLPVEYLSAETAAIEPDEPPSLWMPPVTAVTQRMPWDTFANVLAFVLPRLLFAALVLLAIIYLTFLGLDMASGTDLLPAMENAVPETVAYIQGLLHGDLGTTSTPAGNLRSVPVTEVLTQWLPRSLGLLAIAMLFASTVGIILGFMAARGGSERSLGIIITTIIGVSVPSFFAAFLLQWAVTSFTRLSGRTLLPVGGFGWDSHLILPVLVLAARPLAQITRITFTSVDQVLHQDYVRTAQSKGLRRYQVTWNHVMRNAAIPILATVGISLRFALTGLPIVEFYFGWLGAGFLLLKGIAQQDEALTIALVLCFGILFICVNFILDVSYLLIDPRLKERPSFVTSNEKRRLGQGIIHLGRELWDLLQDNAIANWLKEHHRPLAASPFRDALKQSGNQPDEQESFEAIVGARSPWRAALRNPPLMVGGILVIVLIVAVLAGPFLAPKSPYTTQGLVEINGQLTPPPFPPGETHLWGTDALGRDILSLILAGAKQTLVLAFLAVVARMGVGILLGAIAGWTKGSRLDRFIVGTAEIIAAYPTLLLTMIIILAIGIREGMMPFIIALCFVGWGETMQYVRTEVTSLRTKPFIESAIAVGARTPRIIGRHIMPILFSSLISIAALEMGSVLILLGELGFINIFIGGGALIELPTGAMLYSDVPEWGALLSNVRLLARSYPWTALFPMLAFFIAVLSFNLFGEGIRRMVARGHLIFDRLINRYTLAMGLLILVAVIWLRHNSGAMPIYRQHAGQFDPQRAMSFITEFSDPSLSGRSLGSSGMDISAQTIADEFVKLDLQAGGQKNTFFQERSHAFEILVTTPTLRLDDGGESPLYGQDFAVHPSDMASIGHADGVIRFVGLGKPSSYTGSTWRPSYPELDRLDFSNNVVLTLSDREASVMDLHATGGMLVVTDDPDLLRRRFTLGGLSWREYSPRLWITEEVANRLLAESGYTLDELRDSVEELSQEEVLDLPLTSTAGLQVEGLVEDRWPVKNVIGYLPGTSGMERCQICLGHKLIVVLVQYDSPPIGPDGEIYPAANDNASGLAVMLEAIRVMQETGYQPYKSFVFIAYSGEGLDGGGYVDEKDVHRFLQAKTGFNNFELEAIVHLLGLGAGSGDRLNVTASGSLRLTELVERAADQMNVKIGRVDEAIDIGIIYNDTNALTDGGHEAPFVRLSWEGWDEYAGLPADTVNTISTENLADAGRTLAMTLMILGREVNY